DPGAAPERYLPLLDRAEAIFCSPAGLDAMLRLLDERSAAAGDLSLIALGGAPVLPPLVERAMRRFPDARIRCVYGMSEILPVAIADGAEKLGRSSEGDVVGRIVPSVRARLDEGELVLSGPGLARAYLHELP